MKNDLKENCFWSDRVSNKKLLIILKSLSFNCRLLWLIVLSQLKWKIYSFKQGNWIISKKLNKKPFLFTIFPIFIYKYLILFKIILDWISKSILISSSMNIFKVSTLLFVRLFNKSNKLKLSSI